MILLAAVAAVVALALMHGVGGDMNVGPVHVRMGH